MGGLNSSNTAETAVYSAHSLVQGDPEWRIIAANGWQDNWPVLLIFMLAMLFDIRLE